MCLDEVAHRLADAGAQAALVRAARSGRDAVDVRAHVLVGRLGPLQHEVEPQPFVPGQREGQIVHRLGAALDDDLAQVVDDPFAVLVDDLLFRPLVLEGDLQPLVQVAGDLEPLLDDRRVELDLREDRGVRVEVDFRAAAARGADLLQRADRLALLEAHLPLRAVALDRGDQFLRQGVDHAGADAVQAAGGLVAAVLEFSARMQDGEDHFERAFLGRGMLVDRNAAAVVFDGDRRSIGVKGDPDIGSEPVHRFIDGVVERFPDEMVEAS